MSYTKPYNIIISGVGGQGIFSITRVIFKLCEKYGIKCQGSVFKGGAQRLGSVHSTLRLFLSECPDYFMYSSQIPEQELDLIIGLEPWETLRYASYFNKDTKVFVNTDVHPLFMERYRKIHVEDPVKTIIALGLSTTAFDYTEKALQDFKNKAMANYLIGFDSVTGHDLPFCKKDYVLSFIEQIPMDDWIVDKLNREIWRDIRGDEEKN